MKKISILAFVMLLGFATLAQTKEKREVGDFTKVSYRVPGQLTIREGNANTLELQGAAEDLKEIETEVKDGRLVISRRGNWGWNWNDERINVNITIKKLEGLSVGGSGNAVGEGKFSTGDLKLAVSGSGSLTIEATSSGNVEADVSGSGDLVFKGSCLNFDSDVSGSGKVVVTAAVKGLADMSVSGSGRIEAEGSANEVKSRISGSGKVLASDLAADTCDVTISGSGDVEINVKSSLDATISGSGTVTYKGNPSHVNSHSSGSGRVSKM